MSRLYIHDVVTQALFRYSVQQDLGLKEKDIEVGKIFYRYQCVCGMYAYGSVRLSVIRHTH